MTGSPLGRRGLRTRAFHLVALGMLFPAALLGWASERAVTRLTGQLVGERLLLARSAAEHVDDALRRDLRGLYGMRSRPDGPQDLLEAERGTLHSTRLGSRLLAGVFLADASGAIVWEEPAGTAPSAPEPLETLADALRSGAPAVSHPEGDRLWLFVPLRDGSGGVHGSAGGLVRAGSESLSALLRPYRLGESGVVELLDGSGRIVASAGTPPPENAEVLTSAPLSLLPWTLRLRQARSEAFGAALQLRTRLLLAIPALLGVTLLFAWGTARSVLSPIAVLTGAAERIAGGDLASPVPPLPDDEVGRLGRSLESMRSALAASNEALEGKVAERTRQLQDLYKELAERDARRLLLLRKVIGAQEEERRRIARELHDETCQTVAALVVGVETALAQSREETERRLAELKGVGSRALDELHRIIYDLRPSVLDDLGLVAALQWWVARHLEARGVAVRMEFEGLDDRLPPEVETTVFRVAQEALTNVERHAGAETVLVQASHKDGHVSVEIEDDGAGFDSADLTAPKDSGRGLGLLGMRERVELLGGTLTLDSAPGRGTRVAFEVPA